MQEETYIILNQHLLDTEVIHITVLTLWTRGVPLLLRFTQRDALCIAYSGAIRVNVIFLSVLRDKNIPLRCPPRFRFPLLAWTGIFYRGKQGRSRRQSEQRFRQKARRGFQFQRTIRKDRLYRRRTARRRRWIFTIVFHRIDIPPAVKNRKDFRLYSSFLSLT